MAFKIVVHVGVFLWFAIVVSGHFSSKETLRMLAEEDHNSSNSLKPPAKTNLKLLRDLFFKRLNTLSSTACKSVKYFGKFHYEKNFTKKISI
jgi:hypothetical protein